MPCRRSMGVAGLCLWAWACARGRPAGPAVSPPAVVATQSAVPAEAKSLPWVHRNPADRTSASPQEVARARRFVEKGLGFYRRGEYERAEQLLTQAMTVYPFLADANLALGKIFLIRGSATENAGLMHNAQLMFEMAHALDPKLHETDLLLHLFVQPADP